MCAGTGSSRSGGRTAPRYRCPSTWPSSKHSKSVIPSLRKSVRAITRSASPPMSKPTDKNSLANHSPRLGDDLEDNELVRIKRRSGRSGMPATVQSIDANKAEQELTDGFHLVIDALKLNGINTIYGVPGIPITDLGRMAQAAGIRVISFRHEQNAGNAAAIAGFLTKKPGVCLTVSAPGFLNGLTALANATTNCFPMILISGSSEREIVDLQQGDYEEMDQLAIAKPLCKAAFRVLHAADIGIGLARAIRAASAVKRALDVLKSAKRPLIILGKGAAYAQADDDIRSLIEKSGTPFLPMSMAKGLLPDLHPQCAGAARSTVLKDADVVMLVGARLNWLLSHGKGKSWGESGSKKFIQIDIEPKEMDSNVEVVAPLVGDIGSCVAALLESMGSDR